VGTLKATLHFKRNKEQKSRGKEGRCHPLKENIKKKILEN
jgi:hypothetical protein